MDYRRSGISGTGSIFSLFRLLTISRIVGLHIFRVMFAHKRTANYECYTLQFRTEAGFCEGSNDQRGGQLRYSSRQAMFMCKVQATSSMTGLSGLTSLACYQRLTSSIYLFHRIFCSSLPSQTKLTVLNSSKPSSISGLSKALTNVPNADKGNKVLSGSLSGAKHAR